MGSKGYIASGFVAIMLMIMSVFLPAPSTDNSAKASTQIPAMLLQTIGEAENQCRIARDSCEIDSNRCKANESYEQKRTGQCRANIVRRYENCKNRRLSTLPRFGRNLNARLSPSASDVQNYQDRAVIKACGRKPTRISMQGSCPAASGGCYSHGYCTQQYQLCASAASINEGPAYSPPQPRVERPTPAPTRQSKPKRSSRPMTGWPSNDGRPILYYVTVENTCKRPISVAYATAKGHTLRSWGWKTLKPGFNRINFPKGQSKAAIFLKQGQLAFVRNNRKLVPHKHDSLYRYYIADDREFDLTYDLFRDQAEKPNFRRVQFASLAEGFYKYARRYKIIKCRMKR